MARAQSDNQIRGLRTVIDRGAPAYPESLLDCKNPPKTLYCIGDASVLVRPSLAVVGSRKSTPYGEHVAKLLAGKAAAAGVGIVSGGASGCDSFAHQAALDQGAMTVVVLAGGCDRYYPAGNRGLFQQVVDAGGVIVSERPWNTPALPYMFVARNRIIAALARATLIVEAGLPSGTFSTADEAIEAGRDVLAVPGSIFSPNSRGTNALISQGAGCIVDEEAFDVFLRRVFPDIVADGAGQFSLSLDRAYDTRISLGYGADGEEGEASRGESTPGEASRGEAPNRGREVGTGSCDGRIIAALRANPMRFEELMAAFGPASQNPLHSSVPGMLAALTLLEGQGVIKRFPDGRWGAVG